MAATATLIAHRRQERPKNPYSRTRTCERAAVARTILLMYIPRQLHTKGVLSDRSAWTPGN